VAIPDMEIFWGWVVLWDMVGLVAVWGGWKVVSLSTVQDAIHLFRHLLWDV